jgi:hypothetical protein
VWYIRQVVLEAVEVFVAPRFRFGEQSVVQSFLKCQGLPRYGLTTTEHGGRELQFGLLYMNQAFGLASLC